MIARPLKRRGAKVRWQAFRFNGCLYSVLALHFGLAFVATGLIFVNPAAAGAIHLLLAISYIADSQRWGYFLQRCFRFRPSQNLLSTFPAQRPLRRRIVVVAHADAAVTGWLFEPWLARITNRRYPRMLRFLGKPLLVGVLMLLAAAGMELAMAMRGNLMPRFPVLYVVSNLYFAVVAVLNLQIAWRQRVVLGAVDNLSGCVALPELARRLAGEQPDDVELVFAVSGCEEAGTGGALALARRMRSTWDAELTDIIVVDGLSGGELRLFQEGELLTYSIPQRLLDAASRVARNHPHLGEIAPFAIPAGATDAWPFLLCGYAAMGVGCIDPKRGTPRHYHTVADTPENVDYEQLDRSIDFVELLVRRLAGMPLPQRA
jgi:hypothetical protein